MRNYFYIGLFLLSLFFSYAQAASLRVSPVRVELDPHETVASLELTNTDTQSVAVQIKAMQWTQANGKDELIKTKNMLATPPMLSLSPQGTQTIRVGIISPTETHDKEITYRLLIKEIPKRNKPTKGIQTILQLSVPIFIKPEREHQQLMWSVKQSNAHAFLLKLINQGNTHLQITHFKIYREGEKQPLLIKDIFTYLLPNQTATWDFKLTSPIDTKALTMVATTDRGEITEHVALNL